MIAQPTTAARRIRIVAWLIFVALLVWRGFTLLAQLPPDVMVLAGDLPAYLLPHGVALYLLARLTLDTLGTGLEHRFWGLLWLAIAPVFVAEVYWSWYALTVDAAGPMDSAFVRALHLVAQVLMLVLLVRMTRYGALPLLARVRFHIDVMSALALAWPVVYLGWTLPLFRQLPGGGSTVAAIAAVYPLYGALMVAATTPIAVAPRGARRSWERIVAASLTLYGAALVLNPYFNALALQGDGRGFAWLTFLGGASMALLCVGLLYRLTTPVHEVRVELWAIPQPVSPRVLQYFPVVLAAALVPLGTYSLWLAGSSAEVPLQYASVVVAALLSLRSLIAAVERARVRAAASTDPETGAFDRRLLDDRLPEILERASESGRPVSLIVFDVSDFRRLVVGSPIARHAGRSLVQTILAQAGSRAEVFRLGDDRFAALLEGDPPADAAAVALRVWLAVGGVARPDLPLLGMGIGGGVASFPHHALTADGLLAAAELAVSVARGSDGEPVAIYDDTVEALPADERHARERMRVLRSTVRALAEAVDARDPATRDHSQNVAELATALAQVLDLPDRQVQIVGLGALMHDVGKIGVRDEILLKPGPLEPAERAEIEEHTILGERILAPALLDDILPLVRWHHERWDGAGYPDRLRGEEIPVEARVLAICDAFETLTTGRPYRTALSLDDALTELESCAGSQFDPSITAAFVRMVRGLSGPKPATAAP